MFKHTGQNGTDWLVDLHITMPQQAVVPLKWKQFDIDKYQCLVHVVNQYFSTESADCSRNFHKMKRKAQFIETKYGVLFQIMGLLPDM